MFREQERPTPPSFDSAPLFVQAPGSVIVLGSLLIGCLSLFGPAINGSRLQSLGFGLLAIIYLFAGVRVVAARIEQSPWLGVGRSLAHLAVIGAAEFLFRPIGIPLDPYYFLPLVLVSLTNERRAALWVTVVAVVIVIVRTALIPLADTPPSAFTLMLIPALFISTLLITRLREVLVGHLQRQRDEIQQLQQQTAARAEQLAALHTLSQGISRSLDLEDVCAAIHRSVGELMACDAFFITRYDAATESREMLYAIDLGQRARPVRVGLREDVSSYVIRHRQPVLVNPTQRDPRFTALSWGAGHLTQSMICVPMIIGERVTGAISAQSYAPLAYSPNELELLNLLAAQAGIAIENAHLYRTVQDTATRLAVLNRVSQILTASLEMERVMELLYIEVQRVVRADSYFLATVEGDPMMMRFQFMVDEGVRYPPRRSEVAGTLSAWVVTHRIPLHLDDIIVQAPELGIEVGLWGNEKPSRAWLGVPLITGKVLIGILVVASYTPAAFNSADKELLQSIGQQAAIALDNARHHEEVQAQARLDSLTQVYNHGYFLKRLTEELAAARESGHPLSLIMLDIDYFKQYNDSYGHRTGDLVLTTMVATIRRHIKQSDLVGRWGGEEFCIALPQADAQQAHAVAARISKALRDHALVCDDKGTIAMPTVSQGIASYPQHATDVDALVLLADQALYDAKHNGRDQIMISAATSLHEAN